MKRHAVSESPRRRPLIAAVALLLAGMLFLSSCDLFQTVKPEISQTSAIEETPVSKPDETKPDETKPDVTKPGEAKTDETEPTPGPDPTPDPGPTLDPDPEPPVCENHAGSFACVTCGKRLVPDGFFSGITANAPLTLTVWGAVIPGKPVIRNLRLTLSRAENGTLTGEGTVQLKLTEKNLDSTVRFVLRDNRILMTAVGDMTFEEGVTFEQLGGYADLESLLAGILPEQTPGDPTLLQLLTVLTEQVLPALRKLTPTPEAEDVLARMAEAVFTLRKDDGGYEIALSVEKLKALNDRLAVLTVGDLLDALFGDGTVDSVQTSLLGLMNLTVGDLVKALNDAGIDVEQLLKLLERVMGDDDQSAKLLASIRNFLTNEAFADVRLWGLIPKEDGTTMTEAEARALLVGAFERITGMTVWDVIEALVSSDGDSQPDDGQPSDDGYTKRYSMDETAKPDLHGQVAQLLNALNGAVSLRARLSAKGVLSKIALTLNLPGVVTVSGAELTFGAQPEETYDDVTETVEAAKDELTPERVQQAYQAALEKLGCKNIELRYDEKTGILHIRYAADWETRILPEVTQDSKGRTLLGVCSYTVTAQLNLNDLQYFLFFDSKDVNSRMILPHYGMTAREVTLGQLTLYWVTTSEDGTERLDDLSANEIQQYANLVEAVPPDESAMAEMLDRVQATVILPLAAEETTVS